MSKQELQKLSRVQLRKIPELVKFYKMIHDYSLREEAYAVVIQAYLSFKKKGSKQ